MKYRDIENYICDNVTQIRQNMMLYGFVDQDLRNMSNYYDLANVLGLDTRLLLNADVNFISNNIADIIRETEQFTEK